MGGGFLKPPQVPTISNKLKIFMIEDKITTLHWRDQVKLKEISNVFNPKDLNKFNEHERIL
jgi:hypothetical protein